jgi:hypothetical protein
MDVEGLALLGGGRERLESTCCWFAAQVIHVYDGHNLSPPSKKIRYSERVTADRYQWRGAKRQPGAEHLFASGEFASLLQVVA